MLHTPSEKSPLEPEIHKYIKTHQPTEPVLFFDPKRLHDRIAVFQNGFHGTLTYAVKCNAHPEIISEMCRIGIDEFDVASPAEIELIRKSAPNARLNYNNPIRSIEEVDLAVRHGVQSFSVDCIEELNKLRGIDCEVSIRLKLDLDGSAYHFGDKFGETPEGVVELMRQAHDMGFRVSGTFHVGTQCEAPDNFKILMETMAECAKLAGIDLLRLNVGGGFPSARNGVTPDFAAFFDAIEQGLLAFDRPPQLLAEPGRALIADACQYMVQIKSIRAGKWAFLNDGVYGGLGEVRLMGTTPYRVYDPKGCPRDGQNDHDKMDCHVYGPTCDSIDHFPEIFSLPKNTHERDYILFQGAGAYLLGLNTQFNGYGKIEFVNLGNMETHIHHA